MNWQIIGPLALLFAFAISPFIPFSAFPADLFAVGGAGLYLTARWHLKGCSYALILLAVVGLAGHLFLESYHFLRLALEASLACSFFITALSFESEAIKLLMSESQLASSRQNVQNLEEEIGKVRESATAQQIASAQKIEELEKNHCEIGAEKSTLEILNDVLRKANAAHFEEKSALQTFSDERERSLAAALLNLGQAEEELSRLKKTDMAMENRSLLKELNGARFAKEQTREINETLVRLHARESIRAKEADERLQTAVREKESIERQAASLQEEILQLGDAQVEDLQKSRAAIQERLAAAEEKIHDLIKVEFLYKQLRSQFEEKSKVLHETRRALFKAETELQTVRMEKGEEDPVLSEPLSAELNRLDEEITDLQAENQELQRLVTHLTDRLPQPILSAAHRTPLPARQPSLEETLREALTPKRKKKAKKPAQQDLLF